MAQGSTPTPAWPLQGQPLPQVRNAFLCPEQGSPLTSRPSLVSLEHSPAFQLDGVPPVPRCSG